MATTTVKTIGTTSRQYSTVQAWEDACPANLVTNDEIWKGECYNDSEFLTTGVITFAGATQDATRYKWLTTASGQSFADHADKLTNALTYNQSKGVGIRSVTAYMGPIISTDSYSRLGKLQMYDDLTGNSSNGCVNSPGVGNWFNDCLFKGRGNARPLSVAGASSGSSTSVNCLIISGTTNAFHSNNGANEMHNCTLVLSGGGAYVAIFHAYAAILLNNCALFGFTSGILTGSGASLNASSNYNSTDYATPPSNWGANSQNTKTFASQFESTTVDFRVKSGADLISAGTRDQTFTSDLDIIGQSRSTTTPTIGAWEFISTATFIARKPFMINQAVNRSRTY